MGHSVAWVKNPLRRNPGLASFGPARPRGTTASAPQIARVVL
ncbi:tail protein X [Streptomyces sp. NPDC056237]